MSLLTHLNPYAIEDGSILLSKIAETVAPKSYVDTQISDSIKTISESTARDIKELKRLIEDINNTNGQSVGGIIDKYHRGYIKKIKLEASFTGVDALPRYFTVN